MTIPAPSYYPESYDNDTNLFLVRDALRVRLLADYNPGDKSILVEGDGEVMYKFPPTGIITLTEQCSDIDKRALSFHYSSKTSTSFDDLEILPEFASLDCVKPKRITNVTMNVVAMHHNHLKDSLISVQGFLGTKYSDDKQTITGRIKYLSNIAFKPKAWFSASPSIGLAPLEVTFKNESFRLGPGRVTQTWDFGEGDPVVIETGGPKEYSSYKNIIDGVSIDGTSLKKVYSVPGVYSVGLTVENEYDQSEVSFQDLIVVRSGCPEVASVRINARATQSYTEGDPVAGTLPKIRSLSNSFIDLEIPPGENPLRNGYSYAGELLDPSKNPIDPILEYTWSLGDDLPHSNSTSVRASYSQGGLYDLVVRVDTSFGSYRITKYEGAIDIIESRNLWLFKFDTLNPSGGGVVKAYEFGLLGETFKLLGNQSLTVDRDNGFLAQYIPEPYKSGTHKRAKREFEKNSEFAPYGTMGSGQRGNSLLFWAKGGDSSDSNKIRCVKYNPFDDNYSQLDSILNRPWNWVALNSPEKSYFLFGSTNSSAPQSNPATPTRTDYDLATQSVSASTTMSAASFENGADELLRHPSYFDESGVPTNGRFATYRSAWKDSVGYVLRNSSVNEFFRMSSFYRTNGSLSSPFNTMTRLTDMTGSTKVEGELLKMSNGVFFFNNSGEVCAWNDTTLTWEVGRTGSSALTFRSIQDTAFSGFDDGSNTLMAASDGDRIAYLSYDYSNRAFVKYNGTDLTFTALRNRPTGQQFQMGVH